MFLILFCVHSCLFAAKKLCVLRVAAVKILEFGFVSESEFDERERALQIEFARDIGAVHFDGAVAGEKLFADFLARFFFGDEF